MLLFNKKGPTSFKDLKTVNNEVASSFNIACSWLNLLDNDDHLENALDELCLTCPSGPTLRIFFAIILAYSKPNDPLDLWNKFKI